MQESTLARLREKLKADIKTAIKAPIADLIETIGPVPLSHKLNIESRSQLTDKLLIDLGEKQPSDFVADKLAIIELAGNNHGRELITKMIINEAQKTDELLMIEIGSFLGGSALRWANASSKCRVIAIDPWANDHVEYLKAIYKDTKRSSMLSDISDEKLNITLDYLQANGSLNYTKQITSHQKNIDLVRSQSPAFLLTLYFRQIYPDIIYFDADKDGQDIELAISIFPKSIICGDDYIWIDQNKKNPIMSCLEKLKKHHRRSIIKNGQSWILDNEIEKYSDNVIISSSQTGIADKTTEVGNHYVDICHVCGESGVFKKADWRLRESFQCKHCGGSLREREQAKTILTNVLKSQHSNIKDLVSSGDIDHLTIYEPGEIGAMRRYTHSLKYYIQSALHECADINVQMEDLQALNMQSNTIDLMISSDIIEHVDDPLQAFKEILRVLKPGGCHCFTVPLHRETTRSRVKINHGKKIFLEPKHYHGDGKGGQCLVITDFGYDIVNLLNNIGYSAEIVWCQAQGVDKHVCGTVVAKKPSEVSA